MAANVRSRLLLLRALLRPGWRSAVGLCIAAAAGAALQAGYLWMLRGFLAGAFVEHHRRILVPALLLLGVWAGRSVADFASKIAREKVARGVEMAATELVLRRLVRLSVGFFDRTTQGELVEALRSNIAGLRLYATSLGQALIAAATLAALAWTAVRLEPRLAAIAFVLLPLVVIPVARVGGRLRAASLAGVRAGIRLNDALLQVFRGIRPIKAYGQEAREVAACVARRAEHQAAAHRLVRDRALAAGVLDAAAGLTVTLVIVAAGTRPGSRAVEWPSLLAFLLLLLAALSPLRELVAAYADGRVFGPVLDRLLGLLHEPEDLADPADPVPLPEPPHALEFRGVTHRFGERTVLRDVSLQVRPGETVALVGPTGSGKTTLTNLAVRFYDPSEGGVTLSGVDLRRLSMARLRDAMALVAQEAFLFSATAYDNIAYGKPQARREEVLDAARRAAVHEDLLQLPQGYETVVGPGGIPLSGGQAQRVNLARALLRDAPVLLLDEATSALDSETERRVQQGIRERPARAALVVAHRLSTVRDADRIVVLKDGAVECQGTFAEVLERSPTFRHLWTLQQGPADPASRSWPADDDALAAEE
jgi:ATP-binding cassette, subfamily B, bacterial MsbA